ncbi:hypothetical protein [Demequina phytophila]|uniref:hypothetical protein n=1 Tax=Demequina phytophila TaxID=1638981 RepID=UPI000A6129D2|nr:hypothetical protein [Demequina phytophila]
MSAVTGPDGSALPPHAVRKLENRAWRWKTSWWILPPLVSLGVLCWVGFFWAGIKTAKAKYYVSGGIWLVISLLVIVLPPGGHTAIIAMACFSLATAQAVVMNRRYLIERATLDL